MIDKKTVHEIAHLARLELKEGEDEKMASELTKIVTWMGELNKINTDNTTPLIHMSSEIDVLREDKINHVLGHEKGLKNAPKKDSNYFRVPKVIE
ncbi:MAG: Asp-tRNA(Asn)/Glu-tRNA(Gln) amidotransferase subunit GatC [Cyclobacteriaceae bacterium]